jgi:microcystin-dependent protein
MKPFKSILLAGAGAAAVFGAAAPAHSQVDPYVGQITSFAFGFCPQGWAPASGQLVSVASNPALYSLYGFTYGGSGSTSFGLPNLNGTHAAGSGQGPGLSPLTQGAVVGSETVTLTTMQMPIHRHSFHASSQSPDSASPAGGSFATYPPASVAYVFSPGMWWVGSWMKRFGSSVQHLTMCSYGVRPRSAFSRLA